MNGTVVKFVVFNDYETRDERIQGELVECEVCDGAASLLTGRMCWLKDKDRFSEEEDGRGIEERMCGEEHERLKEDAGPNEGDENKDASLGYDSRS